MTQSMKVKKSFALFREQKAVIKVMFGSLICHQLTVITICIIQKKNATWFQEGPVECITHILFSSIIRLVMVLGVPPRLPIEMAELFAGIVGCLMFVT